jgi:hypothetical protein
MFLQKKVNKLKIKSYAGDLLRQGGKDERWAAVLFILTLVIRDVGSADGLQASRLPYAGGCWKQ